MSSINCDGDNSTPLIARVHELTYYARFISVTMALLYLGITFAQYFSRKTTDEYGNMEFRGVNPSSLDIAYIISRIILVVNFIIPAMNTDSFQWVVNIALAHAVKRLMACKVMVLKLCAFENINVVLFNIWKLQIRRRKEAWFFLRNKADNTSHIHLKGNAEDILAMCLSYYEASGSINHLDVGERIKLDHIIQGMTFSTKLQCLAFAHAQVTQDLWEDGLSRNEVGIWNGSINMG
ncbi:hypothetical protein Acr_24g0003660 [Actinidia rufa]|uniref:Uncharacterized protein n=1 Tax=Actinidia rufa TaxID=165716 RepID=A0A7J0GTR3_9ERIC|nr:hypothetical protein Acr_24g0003660 [Actinidia rufa]